MTSPADRPGPLGVARSAKAVALRDESDAARASRQQDHDDETFFAAVVAVTAAFGDATRRQIYLFVRESDAVTAAEIAKRFALHPNVARHHLDKLAAGGYLEVTLDHPQSGAGRPSKRYRRSSRVAAVPVASRPDVLVAQLLVRALALLEPAVAEQLAEEVGEQYGATLASQIAPGAQQRSMHAAVLTVAEALTAHGFAAHPEVHDATASIVRDHCPFGDVAIEHPVLCAVDRGMVKGLFAGLCGDDVPIQLSSRARGDDSCESIAG